MIVTKIKYSTKFIKQFKKLPINIKRKVTIKEGLFKKNPLHPSLRLHELHGNLKNTWSISVDKNYRIVFERMDDETISFYSIANHDIYKNL
jgi:addiction module RelE/StbE family toxin